MRSLTLGHGVGRLAAIRGMSKKMLMRQAEQQFDRGGLARPVGSQEPEDRVLLHRQVQVLQGLHLFVGLAQVAALAPPDGAAQ